MVGGLTRGSLLWRALPEAKACAMITMRYVICERMICKRMISSKAVSSKTVWSKMVEGAKVGHGQK